jgi:hypothetical protein
MTFAIFHKTLCELRDVEHKFVAAIELLRRVYSEGYVKGLSLGDELHEFLRSFETCPECNDYDRVHTPACKLHPDHDGAPKE